MAQPQPQGRALAFSVSGQTLALPAERIAEVIAAPPITRVPLAPPGLRGLANVRGAVTPILALDVLLDAPQSGAGRQIVVVDDDAPIGLMVDHVVGLRTPGDDGEAVRWLDVESLLARALPPMARRPVTRGVSEPVAAGAPAGVEEPFLTFVLAGQAFGLPLAEVSQVARIPADLAALPLTGDAMIGVVDIHGGLAPVVSLRTLLGFPPLAPSAASRLVIIRLGEAPVALLVDEVRSIIRAGADERVTTPDILNRGRGEARIDTLIRSPEGLVAVLTADRVFDEETMAAVGSGRGQASAVAADDANEATIAFVEFRLGADRYGFPLEAVTEIVRKPQTVAAAPNAPTFLVGLMNHRGTVVPLIDQRSRFAAAADGKAGAFDQVIVTQVDGLAAGLVVDAVERVTRVPVDALAVTAGLMRDDAKVFDRVTTDGRLLLIVDPRELLDQAERDIVRRFVVHAKSDA